MSSGPMSKLLSGKSTAGHELAALLLERPSERPLLGTLRNLAYGMIAGLVLNLYNVFSGAARWEDAFGYLLIGNGLAFFGWGGERLWYATLSPMLRNPFSLTAYASRLPFWYIAGGMGYVAGLVAAKKAGLVGIYEVPIKSFFVAGGEVGILMQVILQFRIIRVMRKHPPRNTSL
jgi:hypothetical protein